MKTLYGTLIALILSQSISSQVDIKKYRNLDSLVKAFLLGKGIICQNIRYSGAKSSIGTFNFNFNTENFKDGLLLSTGDIEDVKGPNNNTAITGNNKTSGDKGLTRVAHKKTFDASVLEFDFISSTNKISFNYFFGSEEYMEYVGSRYNDVFGFFVSGPGMREKNIALVPGQKNKNYVTINNINHKKNQEYFVDNNYFSAKSGKERKLKKLMLDKDNLQNLQYDGFTKVLKAECVVSPGKKYHIRIAIADAGDGVLDSGVFLEKNSFSSERDPSAKENQELNIDSLWFKPGKHDNIPVEIVKSYYEPVKEMLPENENVEFDLDKTKVPDTSVMHLKKMIEKFKDYKNAEIELYGHADTSGNEQHNKQLSADRSKAVAKILMSLGFPEERIHYNAYGSTLPKMSNQSETGRARNRRVEVIIKPKK